MKIRSIAIAIMLLLGLVLSACSFSLAEDVTPPPNYVPPTAAPTLGPSYPITPPNPARGQAIYAAKCAGCHGANGLGNGPQASGLPVPVTAIGLADIARQSSPAAWFTIVSQGRTDRYMPAFTSLSDQGRWDVLAYVYTLSAAPEELQRGASLFAEKCATCHGPDGKANAEADFTNQAFMSQATGISLYRTVAEGVSPSMPAFSGQLAKNDIWALTTYLRTLTFDLTAPTATPQPTATLAPVTATPTQSATETAPADATPAAGVTAEASATPLAAELTPAAATPAAGVTAEASATPEIVLGTVSGTVVRAAGGDLPAGLTVALRGFDHGQDTSGSLSEVVNLSASLGADGSFSFENVEMAANRLFLAEVAYQGVSFKSDFAAVTAGDAALTLPLLTLYETTTDLTPLSLVQVHIVSDFSVANTAQVYEIYVLTNSSQQAVVVPTDGNSIPFIALPENAQAVSFDIAQGSAPLMLAEGGFAILPSANQYGLVAFFTLPYDKKLEVVQPFVLAPASVTLLVPEGIKLSGDQLTDAGVQSIQSTNYQTYTAASLEAGSSLTFTVTGSPTSSTTTTTSPTATPQTSLVIGLGGLGVALILVGLYFFFRDRARRAELDEEDELEEDEEDAEDALGDDPDSLTDAIIALDDQFKAGVIAKEAYEKRRAELKARLKKLS